jgi:hypothetical protein
MIFEAHQAVAGARGGCRCRVTGPNANVPKPPQSARWLVMRWRGPDGPDFRISPRDVEDSDVARPGDRTYQHKKHVEHEALLVRVLALPEREQLEIHEALSASLGGRLGRESERARQARLRHEALGSMRAGAEHLRLPEGQAPTIPEYKRAAKETSLPLTFNAVYRAFEESWDIAIRFYLGEEVPPTAAQRAARRAILGRNRTDKEAPLSGVRLFLSQDPPPASTTRHDYDEWARERNETLSPGELRVIERGDSIRTVLRTGWERCLAVARDEMTLEEAQALTLSQQLSEAGPLVGQHLASCYLGLSPNARHATRAGYPQPVVCLGKTNWLWLLADIEAFKMGKRDFSHERGALQGSYIDSGDLATLLDLSPTSLKSRLFKEDSAKTKTWERLPKPTGRAGKGLYWDRAYAERWLEEHPYAVRGFKRLKKRHHNAVSKISGVAA